MLIKRFLYYLSKDRQLLDAQTLQEKALGAVQRVKEQGEKKADAAISDLNAARAESTSLKQSQVQC